MTRFVRRILYLPLLRRKKLRRKTKIQTRAAPLKKSRMSQLLSRKR